MLNALYGALLNESCRYYDIRIGQSVTLTGRSIARHMNSKVNEVITGQYQLDGAAIIYADTDSSYFTATAFRQDLQSAEDFIAYYDQVGKDVNLSFPGFMMENFHIDQDHGQMIRATRELVASRGLFIKKKRYAVMIIDKEGKRQDIGNSPGKLKAMGLDLKRSDTPRSIQVFLEEILMQLLQGATQATIFQEIRTFRESFRQRPGWEKGTPKRVNNLSNIVKKVATGKASTKGKSAKVTMPGHAKAAIEWNRMCEANDDHYSMPITDGSKIIVCKLKKNPMGMTSIAYPVDEPHLPDWFKEMPFDDRLMEQTIIAQKLENLIGVLDWDVKSTGQDQNPFFS